MRDANGLRCFTCPDCEGSFEEDCPTERVRCELCNNSGDLYTTINAAILDATDKHPLSSVQHAWAIDELEDACDSYRRAHPKKHRCFGCGSMSAGSTGESGNYWRNVCQPCKDKADARLLSQVRTIGRIA